MALHSCFQPAFPQLPTPLPTKPNVERKKMRGGGRGGNTETTRESKAGNGDNSHYAVMNGDKDEGWWCYGGPLRLEAI